ncbi:MAG TPA: hypothetical protein VK188_05990 [Holophaga sp.]|nr:hypothetical protein [Holophaga sp.]
MTWIEDRFRCAALFALGALLPALAVAGLLLAAWTLAAWTQGWARAALVPAILFLALNGAALLWTLAGSFHRPPGRTLREGEAPVLEDLLEEEAASWKAPRRVRIILAPDLFSVELTGVPAGGWCGWTRYHWHVGIFPLLALSLAELRAVVAWEVVFWSDYQGWLNLQVKRLATFWYRVLLRESERQGDGAWHIRRWTFLAAYRFARFAVTAFQPFLAREFVKADQAVAEAHGAPVLARALCRMALVQPLVHRKVFARWDLALERGLDLPADLHGDAARALARLPEDAADLLELAMNGFQRESPPLLRLRLEYLRAVPSAPLAPAAPAYRALLEGTAVEREIQDRWRERISAALAEAAERHEAGAAAWRLADPGLRAAFPDHPGAAEHLELAFHHAPWEEFDHLLAMYRASRPLDPLGPFLAARRALQRGREHHAVMEAGDLLRLDPLQAAACHELLARHLRARGDEAPADREEDFALRARAVADRARRERQGASLGDVLEPHPFAPPELRELLRVCHSDPRIGEVHLVRKSVSIAADRPVLLLVVRMRGAWMDPFGLRRRELQRHLERICPFPSEATGFVQVVGWASLLRFESKLRRAEGLIYRR